MATDLAARGQPATFRGRRHIVKEEGESRARLLSLEYRGAGLETKVISPPCGHHNDITCIRVVFGIACERRIGLPVACRQCRSATTSRRRPSGSLRHRQGPFFAGFAGLATHSNMLTRLSRCTSPHWQAAATASRAGARCGATRASSTPSLLCVFVCLALKT